MADHYDEFDPLYRRVSGDHLHHGLWTTGRQTPGEAVDALVDTVGGRLGLLPGHACVDTSCGYGSTARRLAVSRQVRDGAGSQVTIDMDFEGHGIGRFFIPSVARLAAKRQPPKNLENLKRVLEQIR